MEKFGSSFESRAKGVKGKHVALFDMDRGIFKRRLDQFLSAIKYFRDTIQFFPGACPTRRRSVRRCITQRNYFKRFGERSKERERRK